MSILIRGMEMPKCCAECEWHEYYGGDYDWVHACRRTGTMPIENAETERANDCPLIEVPTPHGELVDRGVLMDIYADRLTAVAERYSPDSSECGILSGAMKLLEIQPTVIEAED